MYSCLIEGPFIWRQVDAGSPVFQPDVVTLIYQFINDGGFYWSAKEIGAHSGAMDQDDRAARRRLITLHVNQVALEAVTGGEGNSRFLILCSGCLILTGL